MKGESITPPPPPLPSSLASFGAAAASPSSSIGNPSAASSWSEISVTGCSKNGGGRVVAAAAASLSTRDNGLGTGTVCQAVPPLPPLPRVPPPCGTFSKLVVPLDRDGDWGRGKDEDDEEVWVNPVEILSDTDYTDFRG